MPVRVWPSAPAGVPSASAGGNILKMRCFIYIFTMLMTVFFSDQSQALLLGEKAKNAPLAGLKNALLRYKLGGTHDSVWQHTEWYCPFRNRTGCRWEVADRCTSVIHLNTVRLKHTAITGKIPLWKVFNVVCVWKRYPSLKDQIFIYYDGTKDASQKCNFKKPQTSGYLGYAWHSEGKNRGICLNSSLLSQKEKLHQIFLHEIQHHIQFIESFPKFNKHCPYRSRMLEAEAYYVTDREALTRKEKREQAPAWFVSGLC